MDAQKRNMQHAPPVTKADPPILLWLKQTVRRLSGRPLLQEQALEVAVDTALKDHQLLGVLLFGSLAARSHTWKSDVDLFLIYDQHEPDSGLDIYYVSGIEVNRFYATLEKAIENLKSVPYLLHMLSEAEVLFDRDGSVTPVVDEVKQYYAAHPDIREEWDHLKESYQIEKRGMACDEKRSALIHTWDQLEEKYSGGGRKRTFFYA